MARLASAAVLLIASVGAVEILQKIPEDVEIIHSWGEKRSGSTFQFMAACVAANLKWRGGDGKPRRTVYCDVLHQESNFDVQVTKSHMIPKPEEGEKKKIVIASTVQEESGKLQKVYATGLPISFRVTRQELVAHSLGILMYYAEAFGLSSEDQHVMRDFMKSWEIMRQCCGSQMSKNWRIKLQEGTRTTAPWCSPQAALALLLSSLFTACQHCIPKRSSFHILQAHVPDVRPRYRGRHVAGHRFCKGVPGPGLLPGQGLLPVEEGHVQPVCRCHRERPQFQRGLGRGG
mmetsp:Transcript_20074/g.60820  ORF Transcript_20074/g.60820 Transcript_20074/m.60820 type:complete len:289 (-) Transcript_20074:1197-2063(-)